MTQYVAAIDQGTTGTRCMIFDAQGNALAARYEEHRQIYPRPGWVEHDPQEIWVKAQRVTRAALQGAGLSAERLCALGIANQRETTVVWDRRTGKPYHNAIVWQCTRTREICQGLIDDGLESLFRERTGLVVATYFAGPKLRWLLDHLPGLRGDAEAGHALFGTVDSWLLWNLTGGPEGGVHATDVTNASRTMLMDLHTLDWDDALLDALAIPRAMLPTIRPSSETQAPTTTCFGAAVPLSGIVGDQQAALVGQTCFAPGEA